MIDRSTAYPMFGIAGRPASARSGVGRTRSSSCTDSGASVLGYARAPAHRASAPLVLNPQGLEEFGATDPSRAQLKRAAYLPLRRAVLALRRGR